VVYINGRPFVLRDVERPFSNLEYTRQKGVIARSALLRPGGLLACELAKHAIVLQVDGWISTGVLLLDGNTLNYFGKSIQINLALAVIVEVVLLRGAEYYRITNGLEFEYKLHPGGPFDPLVWQPIPTKQHC
ncbi:hypothetical protein GIB67_010907, partial [Kingdonia uniflora]